MGGQDLYDAIVGESNQMKLEKPEIGTDGAARRSIHIGREVSGTDTGSASMTPRALLVCFSGKIGSGKTSISSAVAKVLGCGYTSFSDYLRDMVAKQGGDPDCRELLQDLGQSRIEQDAELFCRDVLAGAGFVPGENFVLDGVRHVQVLQHLREIAAPSEVRLIFLKAGAGLRSIRVGQRSAREGRDFKRAANHVVEADMDEKLPAAAHAFIDGSLSALVVLEQCIKLIDNWRWAGAGVAPEPDIRGAVTRTQRA